jgi:starvation-inducible DNA-binding protein
MLHRAPLTSSTTFSEQSLQEFSQALTLLLSDVFALYLKTKNFHWHMSGSHFRDYHLILDDQGEQIFAMTDAIAERARKLGGATVRSIGPISRSQRIADKRRGIRQAARDAGRTSGRDSGSEHARDTFACDEAGDVATASLLEEWIDETEKRTWFFLDCP